MKHIKLFEWFLKTRNPEEILRWGKPINNPLKSGRFKDVTINSKGVSPRTTKGVKTLAREIYEFPNDDKLLNDVKYMTNLSDKEISTLLDYGLSHMPKRIDLLDYDTILIPETRSKIVYKILDSLYDVDVNFGKINKSAWQPKVFNDAFLKRKWNDVEWNMELINKTGGKTREDVLKLIDRLKRQKGNETVRLSGNIIPIYRKFISRFMDINPEIVNELAGKKIIILDDFVTDGTTRKQMRDLTIPYKPASILNLALFHIRGKKQESDPS
jgi:hypothetical protein